MRIFTTDLYIDKRDYVEEKKKRLTYLIEKCANNHELLTLEH